MTMLYEIDFLAQGKFRKPAKKSKLREQNEEKENMCWAVHWGSEGVVSREGLVEEEMA